MTINFRTNFYQSTAPVSNSWLLPRAELQRIATTFKVSQDKINSLHNDWDLQNKCFRKIVRAYEKEDWSKINSAAHLIVGIKDFYGRSVSDVFKNKEHAPQNFAVDSPENLVFQGGGPKGIAYIGALRVLEERGIFANIKRVAGTSAGAITAIFLALGYSVDEAQDHLMGIQLIDLMDTTTIDKNAMLDLFSARNKKGCRAANFFKHLKNVFNYLHIFHQCLHSPGLCKGEVFLQWISQAIQDKTGDPHFTFGELRQKVKQDTSFKHLHIFATQVKPTRKILRFSSENKKWDNLVISYAVRASMSLPVAFHPSILHFKTSNNLYLEADPEERLFIDGGSRNEVNFPLWAFDKEKYIKSCELKSESQRTETNKRTLGFALYDPVDEVHKDGTTNNIRFAAAQIYREHQDIHKNEQNMPTKLTKYDYRFRIIKIDNCDVDTFEFNVIDQKIQELIASGHRSADIFFSKSSNVSSIINNPIFVIPEPELHITEREAKKILTLGPRGQKFKNDIIAINVFTGTFITIFTLGIGAAFILPDVVKHNDTDLFKLLALDDSRFKVFEDLSKNKIESADLEFEANRKFLSALMKTGAFVKEFIKCLKNCDNNYNGGSDQHTCNRYINFFVARGVVSNDFNDYLIHQTEKNNKEDERYDCGIVTDYSF